MWWPLRISHRHAETHIFHTKLVNHKTVIEYVIRFLKDNLQKDNVSLFFKKNTNKQTKWVSYNYIQELVFSSVTKVCASHTTAPGFSSCLQLPTPGRQGWWLQFSVTDVEDLGIFLPLSISSSPTVAIVEIWWVNQQLEELCGYVCFSHLYNLHLK